MRFTRTTWHRLDPSVKSRKNALQMSYAADRQFVFAENPSAPRREVLLRGDLWPALPETRAPTPAGWLPDATSFSTSQKTLQGSGGSAQQVTIGISTMCLCQRSRVRRQHQRSPTRPHWQKINPVLVAAPHVASFQPVEQTKFQPPCEFPKSSSHLCSARRSLLVDLSDLVRQLVALFHRFAKRIRRSWRGTSSACLHGFGLFGLAVDRPAMKPCSWSLSSLEKMFNVRRSIFKFRVPASQSETEVGEHFTKLELRALLAVSLGNNDPRRISTTDGSMPWTAASASAIFRGDDQAASACRSSRR